MKVLLLPALIFFATSSAFFQEKRAVWEGIIPLYTTRQEIEKKFGKNENPRTAKYTINGEQVTIEYSMERCTHHGWNVVPQTVLSYKVYFKSLIKLSDLKVDINKLVVSADHAAYFYYADLERGIQFVQNNTSIEKEVRQLAYIPSSQDNKLRCKGFPPYNPANIAYRPVSVSTFENVNRIYDDVGIFLEETKEYPDNFIGYVFFYLKKNLPISRPKSYLRLIKNYVYQKQKISPQKIKIEFGGYRDSSEVETFLLSPKLYPPTAEPKYPTP